MSETTLLFWCKLLVVPIIVGAVSLAESRWGAIVSGWLISLPLTSGPVVLFLALEQGVSFASKAAEGTIVGLISLCAFCLVYGSLASSHGWAECLLASCLAFFTSAFILNLISIPFVLAFSMAVCFLVIVPILLPHKSYVCVHLRVSAWEIPFRMIAATVLVVALTAAATTLGPLLSGLLATFPIYASVMAIFVHRYQGSESVSQLLRGLVVGLYTFAAFYLVVKLTVVDLGIILAFLLASAIALVLHGSSLVILRRHRTAT